MRFLIPSANLVVRRLVRNWRLVLTAVLGVTLATALLAGAPPYAAAVAEFGLRRALHSADPADSQIQAGVFQRGLDRARHRALDRLLAAQLETYLGDAVAAVIPSAASRRFVVWQDGAAVPKTRASLVFYDGFEQHVRLTAGRLPAAAALPAGEIEAAVPARIAEQVGLAVGDVVELRAGEEQEPVTGEAVRARIAGIVEPLDAADAYWFGRLSPLDEPAAKQWEHEFALLVTRDAFFDAFLPAWPDAGVACSWNVLLHLDRIHPGNWGQVKQAVVAVQGARELAGAGFRVETGLPAILDTFQRKLSVARTVIVVLGIEIAALVVYYILMTSALIVRQQSKEIAVLKSRGGSSGQVRGVQAVEALAIAGAAAAAAPFVAAGLLRLLPRLGPFAALGTGAPAFVLTPAVFPLALGAAAGSWLALWLPTLPAARRTMVTFQQEMARPARTALWHRYYLDLFLVAAAALAFWRLRASGLAAGGFRFDPLLLLSPVLLMLGGALVFLRVIPLLLSLLARLLARARGACLALAAWQVARNPVHYSRLVLLLALAVALGLFSAGFSATLANSYVEQARYQAGADLRVVARQPEPEAAYLALPGVAGVSRALRTTGTIQGGRFDRFELLGADLTMPAAGGQPSFLQVTSYYRADFADQPLQVLFRQLAADAPADQPGVELPGEPAAVGVWAYALPDAAQENDWLAGESDLERTEVGARLVDAQGAYWLVPFSPAPAAPPGPQAAPMVTATGEVSATTGADPGWQYLSGPIPAGDGSPAYPVRLVNLYFKSRARYRDADERPPSIPAALYLADLSVGFADGRERVVLDLGRDGAAWQPMSQGAGAGGAGQSIRFERGEPAAHGGRSSLLVRMTFTGSRAILGMAPDDAGARPIAALVSDGFLAATGLEVGDTVRASVDGAGVVVQVAGVLHYFPTLYDREGLAFAVCNRDRLLARLNIYPTTTVEPNEIWLNAAPGAAARLAATLAGRPGVERVWQQEELWRDLRSEPLSLGLDGIFAIGYVVALMLSIVGFTVYLGLTARQRAVEFGVLRAIGLSPGQLLALLCVEQAVLIALGLAAGTGLGLALSRLVLPFMAVSFEGRAVAPPFLPVVDWSAIQGLYATLLGAFALAFAAATLVLARLKMHRALTMGEE